MPTNLPSILRQAELISPAQEIQLNQHAVASNNCIPEALISLGLHETLNLADEISRIFSMPITNLAHYDYPNICQQLGLRELITRYLALPISQTDQQLTIAVADPTVLEVEDEFRFATGMKIELVLSDFKSLQAAIRRLYGRTIGEDATANKEINQQELADLVEVSSDELTKVEDLSLDNAPVSRYINQILLDAVRKGASDIHFEPYEESYRVRLRCDGILVEIQQPNHHLSRRLSARIKILSKLDIAERRLPQDGRIKLKLNQKNAIDVRVSTLPTLWGEKIVLRLLNSSEANLDIEQLGYSTQQKQLYLQALQRPQGMILITGPTGSGKTVSLYSGLNILNTSEVNIATAEDPIEINLPGINQVQVQPHIGFGFPEALRAFLRQDPDIVMVGEIRDIETAEIAVKAAQTGHLVLSTLHTNSAAETVTRLRNMGVAPFNIASSLSLIIAQRLIRKLCQHCKQPHHLNNHELETLKLPTKTSVYQANKGGCTECNYGYSGRTGVYEIMNFTHELSQAVSESATSQAIEQLACQQGMKTLHHSGVEKLVGGITSYQELLRVIYK